LPASFPAAPQDISPGAIFTALHCVDDLSLWLADDVFDREPFDLMRLPGRVATRNTITTTKIARMIMTNRVFMVHPHYYSEARRWGFLIAQCFSVNFTADNKPERIASCPCSASVFGNYLQN